METNIKKPQIVKSYVRHQKIEETEAPTIKDNRKVGKALYYGLIAYSALLLFTPGWVIGLPIVTGAAIIHGTAKVIEYKNTPRQPKLTINYMK